MSDDHVVDKYEGLPDVLVERLRQKESIVKDKIDSLMYAAPEMVPTHIADLQSNLHHCLVDVWNDSWAFTAQRIVDWMERPENAGISTPNMVELIKHHFLGKDPQ